MNLTVERTTSTAHRLMHHDGPCSNVHGHNLTWSVDLDVDLHENLDDDTNMPVDFKVVSGVIDQLDHALVLNEDDPLFYTDAVDELGEIVTIGGDPTCEALAERMARNIFRVNEQIKGVEVTLQETEKYAVSTVY